MSFHCLICQQPRPDGNLACQRVQCSATRRIEGIQPGQILNDLTIGRLIKVTRNATYYEASRGKESFWMKLAHPNFSPDANDHDMSDYLKKEAVLLYRTQTKFGSKKQPRAHVALPEMVSAWPATALTEDTCYQKVTYQGQLRYYFLLRPLEGVFLSSYLDDYAQPYYKYVIWLFSLVSSALDKIREVDSAYIHIGLNPDSIVVRVDALGILRPTLMDLSPRPIYQESLLLNPTLQDMWQRSAPQSLTRFGAHLAWLNLMIPPVYTAPDLLQKAPKSSRLTLGIEQYNVALLLHQMLTGEEPFQYRNLTDDMIYKIIEAGITLPLTIRPDLKRDVTDAMRTGLEPRRQGSASLLMEAMRKAAQTGDVPNEVLPGEWRQRWLTRENVLLGLTGTMAVLVFLLMSAALAQLIPVAIP